MVLTEKQIQELSSYLECEPAALKAVIEVESTGEGFDPRTGKIKIQFEPHWFKKYTGVSIPNKVDIQKNEWKAFNAAWKVDPKSAMLSTSWGAMQVMGFNHKRVGFRDVGSMVDFAKKGEYEQVVLGVRFIKTENLLVKAIQEKNWRLFAKHYNGPNYEDFDYDNRLRRAYIRNKS